jgi:hypothetical protein
MKIKFTLFKKLTKEEEKEVLLKRLLESNVLQNFVKENEGFWNYDKWKTLLLEIQKNEYGKIESDTIYKELEKIKLNYIKESIL